MKSKVTTKEVLFEGYKSKIKKHYRISWVSIKLRGICIIINEIRNEFFLFDTPSVASKQPLIETYYEYYEGSGANSMGKRKYI